MFIKKSSVFVTCAGEVVMDTDEHPKPQTTVEMLAKLPPVFKKGGTVNAGNASVRFYRISTHQSHLIIYTTVLDFLVIYTTILDFLVNNSVEFREIVKFY